MITDEQLIESLSRSMKAAAADVFPPDDLLDGVTPARAPHVRLPSVGGVVATASAALALAVAFIAITSLGRAPTSPSQRSAPRTQPALHPRSLAALRSELAILRQPQRPADAIPAWGITAEERQQCSNCLNVATLIPRETRLLTTVQARNPSGPGRTEERVYLVFGKVPRSWGNGLSSGWRQRGPAIEGLHLSLVGLTNPRSPFAQPANELLNFTDKPMPADLLTPRDVMITGLATIGVVPDGVTRVKWELANPGQTKPVTVYPRVHGNLAIAPWTPAPRSTSLLNEQWLIGATWYGPDGHVIASFTGDLAQIGKG